MYIIQVSANGVPRGIPLTQLVKGGYTDDLAKKALNMSLPEAYFKTHSLRVGESNFLAKMADGVY